MAAALRNALANHLRVRITPRNTNLNAPLALSLNNLFHRYFSEEVKVSFLDKDEVADRVCTVCKSFSRVNAAWVTPTAHFKDDLGLDSLETLDIILALEEEFGIEIPFNEADNIVSIGLAVDFIASHPQAK